MQCEQVYCLVERIENCCEKEMQVAFNDAEVGEYMTVSSMLIRHTVFPQETLPKPSYYFQ